MTFLCIKRDLVRRASRLVTLTLILGSVGMSFGIPLNDGWTADGVPVTLPHCWNVVDGAVVFRYRTQTAGNNLTFAYTPGDDDMGGALLAEASGGPRFVVIIR